MKRLFLSLYAILAVWGVKAADMPYSLELSQLYIIGDATPYAWDTSRTPDMEKINEGLFRWTGHLEAGKDFKFLNTRAFHKHIVGTSADQNIQVGQYYDLNLEINWELPGDKDLKFKPTVTGDYTVYVDLQSMKMVVCEKEDEVELPEKLYATGTALGGKVVELPQYGNVEFKTLLDLQPGNLILQDTPEATSSTKYYTSLFEGVDISFGQDYSSSLKCTTDKQTEGWSVSVPGKYTLYAIKDKHQAYAKIFKPRRTLYLVGGCLKKYWDYWTDPATCQFTPSSSNPEELVWEGYLSPTWSDDRQEPSKLKILTNQSWTSETFHPYVADTPLVGEGNFRSSGGDDVKWEISEAGNYRITINTATETIRGELLGSNAKELNAVTEVRKVEQDASVQIVCGKGTIYVKSTEKPVTISVCSIDGKQIASYSNIQEGVVAEGLAKGVYIVKTVGARTSCPKKIMID